jgi:hypothetical protein
VPLLLLRAFAVWLVLIAVETIYGILRTLLFVPLTGDFSAGQVSVLTGSVSPSFSSGGLRGYDKPSPYRRRAAVGADRPLRDRPAAVRPRPLVGPALQVAPPCSEAPKDACGHHQFIAVIDTWRTVAMDTHTKYGTCTAATHL